MFKEYRCQHCNKLFFKGNVKDATIEIKCRYCKNINLIKANSHKLLVLNDNKEIYKPKKVYAIRNLPN